MNGSTAILKTESCMDMNDSSASRIRVINRPTTAVMRSLSAINDAIILLVWRGVICWNYRGRSMECGTGLLFLVRAYDVNTILLSEDCDCALTIVPLMILARLSFPELGCALINAMEQPFIPLNDSALTRFCSYFRLIASSDKDGRLHHFPTVQLCGAMVSECQIYYQPVLRRNGTHRGMRLTNDFLVLASRNSNRERYLSFYADRLCVSLKHLSYQVLQCTGTRASVWLRRYVEVLAKEMLMEGSRTIGEVAVAMNFRSTSDFSSYFRRATGMSPGQYLKSVKKESPS